jgi:hypothetical protein
MGSILSPFTPQFAIAYSGKASVAQYLTEKVKEGKINFITIKAGVLWGMRSYYHPVVKPSH